MLLAVLKKSLLMELGARGRVVVVLDMCADVRLTDVDGRVVDAWHLR